MTIITDESKWLQYVVQSLEHSEQYSIVAEGEKYAVIRQPGRNYWSSGTGICYSPTKYLLVEKGVNYWGGTWKHVGTGRLTKLLRRQLLVELEDMEKKYVAVS